MNDSLYDYALRCLRYEPETGEFYWRVDRLPDKRAGDRADIFHKCTGYRTIKLRKRRYYAHRIAWLMMHGKLPELQIDHINRNRQDNRISNLRDVDGKTNVGNKHFWTGYQRSFGLLGCI